MPEKKQGPHESKFTPQMTIFEFERLFPNEDACRTYLVAHRWPSGIRCPRCGNEKVWELGHKPWHWQCQKCSKTGYRFSVIAGTIFENTNYPLKTWFRVLFMMLTSKKGVSAALVHRTIGSGSYRTAWFLCHRLRAGMKDPNFKQLLGIVEIDESDIGGKAKNRHGGKNLTGFGGPGMPGKPPSLARLRGRATCLSDD